MSLGTFRLIRQQGSRKFVVVEHGLKTLRPVIPRVEFENDPPGAAHHA